MATQPINFKRVGTPSYRTYRVLQARGDWGQLYRARVALYGDLHGAIIFPEQLFTLNQNAIYAAAATPAVPNANNAGCTVGLTLSVHQITSIGIHDGINNQQLTHSEQVLEYEENHFDKDGLRRLTIMAKGGSSHQAVSFGHFSALFTNRESAARFLEREVRTSLRKLIP
jgi:hypothetical protein